MNALGLVFASCLVFLGVSRAASAQPTPADPFVRLEDIHGAETLDWVRRQNARTAARLEADIRFEPYREAALALFTAKDRIPYPDFRNDGLDNVWQDRAHPHGVWRRTTLASYPSEAPQWEPLLDLDALSKAEGKSWFWKSAKCLKPEERYCLIDLSNGGGDAVVVREFDTQTKTFVPGGFDFDNGKQSEAWIDKDTVIAARDWGSGTLTKSGYAYIIKIVKRGESLSAAKTVFQGQPTDGAGARAGVLRGANGGVDGIIFQRDLSDYDVEYSLQSPTGPMRIDLPRKSRAAGYIDGQYLFTIQQDWRGFKAGALLAYDLKALKAAPMTAPATLILQPGPRNTIDAVRTTKSRVWVQLLSNVTGRMDVYDHTPAGWTHRTLDLPKNSALTLRAASDADDKAFIASESFLDPTALWLADGATGAVVKVKQSPARFDASGHVVEQHFATSKDGTPIPYFLVRPKNMPYDGSTPTQMFGYGGFLISEVPTYKPELGKLWLEKGGAYVLTNIRGGGEFGPAWHDAALRENRQRAFDDFAAVAEDLFKTKVTSPRRLGIYGRSNGGVLMTVSMTQHPDYWGAIVIESPLVDMLRYSHLSAGASWIGEYGDPDIPADRAFIAEYSAYQLIKPGVKYPEPYITTNTEDDRVHPGHARKLAAKLESLGDPYLYYENTFGGHANDADPELNARRWARHYVYLAEKLMD